MYSVALVQNQSEMSHYGYADARPLIEEFSYRPFLFTAQNIDDLPNELDRLKFDAIIFASNALNDKTIRNEILSERFINSFINFIKTGRGCLILHQLKMAQENISLKFLPDLLNVVKAKEMEKNEKASDGDFFLTSISNFNVCFLYPNKINVSDIKNRCLSFKSLKGLYWHYWTNISNTDWDILLYDIGKDDVKRPLILTTKEFESYRIVLSSLTLDWQKQKELLRNIMTFVVEGKHTTALLRDLKKTSTGFDYFIECLNSQKYPFMIYDIRQNLGNLMKNIENGVHKLLLYGPFIKEKNIENNLLNLIYEQVRKGNLKLLSIMQDDEIKKFYIAGREKFALRLLYELELKLQHELYNGYIDGSFWSTVESIQILDEMKDYIKSDYDNETLKNVLSKAKTHESQGSYDEVFGVTCALLWIKSKSLGIEDHETNITLKWIRSNLKYYEEREKALAYYTLINIGIGSKKDRESLKEIIYSQQNKFDNISEIDLIFYLKSSLLINLSDVIIPIIRSLDKKQNEGVWVDLATTATAISALIDYLLKMKKDGKNIETKIKSDIESLIYKSIIYIQNHKQDPLLRKNITYPWDNKASTSLKCIQAWLKFEELIDLPVHEIIDALKSYSFHEINKSSNRTALTILEELRDENSKLVKENSEYSIQLENSKKYVKINRILELFLFISMYFILSIIIKSLIIGFNVSFDEIVYNAFIESWAFHIPFLTLITSIYAILPIWKYYIKKEGNSENRLP